MSNYFILHHNMISNYCSCNSMFTIRSLKQFIIFMSNNDNNVLTHSDHVMLHMFNIIAIILAMIFYFFMQPVKIVGNKTNRLVLFDFCSVQILNNIV